MYFALDQNQLSVQESVRAFARTQSTEAAVRESMAVPDGLDTESWKRLAVELGVVTLGSGAGTGGAGGSFVDAAVVLEVLGNALYPGPYLSSVVATQALMSVAPGDPATDLLAAMAGGTIRVATVFPRASGDRLAATTTGEGVTVSGEFTAVPDGAGADVLFVAGADTEWFEVAADAAGLARTALSSFDQTRRLARVVLADTPARPVTLTVTADALRERLGTAERIAVAAELVGVARHALDAGVEYAKAREQFGRPIGSFQALQFWFADVALSVECAWSAAYAAAWDHDHDPSSAARSSALALATAGDASMAAAEQMLQVNGGVGFTWDNPSHLYLKRAKSNRLLWGHPDEHRRRLGELLEL